MKLYNIDKLNKEQIKDLLEIIDIRLIDKGHRRDECTLCSKYDDNCVECPAKIINEGRRNLCLEYQRMRRDTNQSKEKINGKERIEETNNRRNKL